MYRLKHAIYYKMAGRMVSGMFTMRPACQFRKGGMSSVRR
ncbi:hypothetical protein C900_01628 [Fulvivirga imtechensis AK7]|uniref:Uncharacterized protein n=1 Tax=Fulvivirga imtechensis AK7 TaxID=1237149 RepID=L8JTN5_9BACT|nr:hypothetical protein C900_01628 [Fulvivirga imtechensis AK7]